MKARVDPEKCILCGLCADTCPDLFELGERSSRVKLDPVPPDREACAQTAADNCPGEAIELED